MARESVLPVLLNCERRCRATRFQALTNGLEVVLVILLRISCQRLNLEATRGARVLRARPRHTDGRVCGPSVERASPGLSEAAPSLCPKPSPDGTSGRCSDRLRDRR